MSLNPSSVTKLDDIIKDTSNYSEINAVIEKEKGFLSLITNYNTIHQQYSDELKKDNPSREILQKLLMNLNDINNQLKYYSTEIKNIKDVKMDRFRNSILDKNDTINENIEELMQQLNDETIELTKLKQRVSDAEGINKEYGRQIKSTNYKYLILLFITIFLIFSIILSITVPYKTNLESYLFIILCIVILYYFYTYIKQYKNDMNYKINNHVGNIKHFLNVG